MDNVRNAVTISYGILGGVAWVWFTRRWSFAWRVLPLIGLALIWLAVTLHTTHDNRYDPDLGIRPSSLTFGGAAIWSFPLALVFWLPFMCLVLFARHAVRKRV
jgi:hypothetical protein